MFSSALKSFSSNITSNYQVSPHPVVISGPWRVHDGKKKSTGTAASVFIFEKKSIEPRSSGLGKSSSNSSTKKLQEEAIERLKREASSLARLRHPSILQVLEPVEDTRNGGLMFVTEHVTASLGGMLRQKDDQERAGSRTGRHTADRADGSRGRVELEIDELEVQKGLLQVAKGLEFLHESAGLVHGNLNPESIFINSKSDWKISGLGFAGPPDSSESRSALPPLALSEVLYQDPRLPPSVQLNMDYTSPDFAMDSNVSPAADLFSLGLIIVAIYNTPHVSPIQTHSNLSTYKKALSSPSSTPSQGNNFLSAGAIPKDLASHVLPRLITRRPAQRLNAKEFQQSQYFDNILVSTIRFLESLPTKNPSEKSQFMRGLQRVLPEFPVSVLERKILGALLDEMKDRDLLPLILQNTFIILQRVPNARRVFPEKVIPRLKETFPTGSGKPQERDSKKDAGLMVVLDNMKVIADNCSGMEFKDDILPLIRLGFDSPTHSLSDTAIKCLPVMLPALDFTTVKNEVFPPIASTFSRTSSLAIKVRCLEAFAILCGGQTEAETGPEDDLTGVVPAKQTKSTKSSILDKYTIQEKLMPSLKAIKTKEPAVMMAALSVFRQIGTVADTDFLALEVLPVLWNFALGPLLDLKQFEQFMALIKTISNKIEREQKKKLQELSSGDTDGFQNGAKGSSKMASSPTSPESGDMNNTFERLVLGKDAPKSGDAIDPWDSLDSGPSVAQASASTASPAFAWSSTAPAAASISRGSTPSIQPNPSYRSVTPDYNLNSFPSLEPAAPAARQVSPMAQGFPALQPSPSGSWNMPNPSMGQRNVSGSSASGPSLATMATMKSANAGSFGQPAQTPASNYSAFAIPPPPSNPMPQQQSAFGSGFPPAPSSTMQNPLTNTNSFQQQQQQQQPPPGKKGLDKYESLL